MVPFQLPFTMAFALTRCFNRNATRFIHLSIFSRRDFISRSLSRAPAAKEDSSIDTQRLPLGKIFKNNDREYLFSTRKNIRDYEWTVDEAEDLFESILSLSDDDDPLELGAVTIMETKMSSEAKKKLGKLSKMYDVHDGQQRLITLCLLLAAIRDSFHTWGEEYSDDAADAAGRIYPQLKRCAQAFRIEVREKHAKALRLILQKMDENGANIDDLLGDRKNLAKSDQRVLDVYRYFRKRINDLGEDATIHLLERFDSDVYLLVCVPSDTKIARNIVMGQGKGKNIEPVDEFKGLVCFTHIGNEDIQDEVLEQWNNLSDEVERDVLGEACILVAQGELRKALRKNQEVDLLEDYLNKFMAEGACGKEFFKTKVEPAAKILKQFKDGGIKLGGNGNPNEAPSLSFLRSATDVATSKEVKIAVLGLLLKHNTHKHTRDVNGQMLIEQQLKTLEGIALWSMLAKPKPKERLERCLSILHSTDYKDGSLSQEEKNVIREILDTAEFGAKAVEIKKVKAILERLNEYSLLIHSQTWVVPEESSKLHVEHVLPQKHSAVDGWTGSWTPNDSSEWKHRLGNLVLLNEKKNSKIGNAPFDIKSQHLEKSPYPLTNRISKYKKWNLSSVKENHKEVLDLVEKVFF